MYIPLWVISFITGIAFTIAIAIVIGVTIKESEVNKNGNIKK